MSMKLSKSEYSRRNVEKELPKGNLISELRISLLTLGQSFRCEASSIRSRPLLFHTHTHIDTLLRFHITNFRPDHTSLILLFVS